MTLDTFSRDYLRLTLEIDKHIDGYVDAYYGPDDIKAEAKAAPKREPAALLTDVANLQTRIPDHDPARGKYLKATLRALDCTVRMLNGERFDYLDEVNRLYDIKPELLAESCFIEAHNVLDTLIPGQEPVAKRLQSWRKGFELAKEQVLPLLELAKAETRQRTQALFSLPEDQDVEVRLTENQPWGAYNWYLGNGRSLIEFNTDIPLSALGLLSTFAHEGYPGHHTEAILKEQTLYRQKGYGEQAAMLLHSPAAVIAEGIATTAVEIIFPGLTHHQWNLDVMLPAAGIASDLTADNLQSIVKALANLRHVTSNAAILFHTGQNNQKQTIEYIQTYGLSTPERSAKSFSFLSHPLFRSYLFTYTEGHSLIAAAANGDKQAIFSRLLTEQILPSQLAKMAG